MADSRAVVASPFDAGNASQAERASRQLSTYWRIRIHKNLERIEYEARRMFALEAELGQFAEHYHASLGPTFERLANVESQLSGRSAIAGEMDSIESHREMRALRRAELKSRYRTLAKDIHPDRAMVVESTGDQANQMHDLNDAYAAEDLARLLRIEASQWLGTLGPVETANTHHLEEALHDISRAADTYQHAYRELLTCPINSLMLRALSARIEGWDWMDGVRRKVERIIEAKERSLLLSQQAVAHRTVAA